MAYSLRTLSRNVPRSSAAAQTVFDALTGRCAECGARWFLFGVRMCGPARAHITAGSTYMYSTGTREHRTFLGYIEHRRIAGIALHNKWFCADHHAARPLRLNVVGVFGVHAQRYTASRCPGIYQQHIRCRRARWIRVMGIIYR